MAHAASQWQIAVSGTSWDASTGFASTVFDSGEDASNLESYTDAGPLASGTAYEASVRHKSDTEEWSDWAEPEEFSTLANDPPTAPGQPTPNIEDPYDTDAVTWTWGASTDPDEDAVTYDVRLSPTGGSSVTLASGLEAASYEFDPSEQPDGPYRLEVRAADGNGGFSVWVASDEFTIDHPDAPVLRPAGFTATTATVEVEELDDTWLTNIYQHALTSDFASPTEVERTGDDQGDYTASGLSTGVAVYFRTRGTLSGGGETPWSNTVRIVPEATFEDQFDAPNIFTAPRFHIAGPTAPQFCWSAESDATSFAVAGAFESEPDWVELADEAALVGLACYTPDMSDTEDFPDGMYVGSVVVDGVRFVSQAFVIDRSNAALDLDSMPSSTDGWSVLGNTSAPWTAISNADPVCSQDPSYPRPVTSKFRQHGPNVQGSTLVKADITPSNGWEIAATESVWSAGIGIGGGIMYEAEHAEVSVVAANESMSVSAYMGSAILDFQCGKTVGTSASGEFGVEFRINPGVFGPAGFSFVHRETAVPFAASFNTPLGRCGCNLPYGSRQWPFRIALRYSVPDPANFPQQVRIQALLGSPYNLVIDETIDVPSSMPLTDISCLSPGVGSAHVPNFVTQDFGWRQTDSFYARAIGDAECGEVADEDLTPPEEFGIPCVVEYRHHEPDGETVAWSSATSILVGDGILQEPNDYAEQEVNFPQGAVTIGNARVELIDPPIAGATSQDEGLTTSRLPTTLARTAIMGRRGRLRRFTDEGWVTLADGPCGPPRMDPSYASYEWEVRDTRERERRLPAFTRTCTTSMLPRGIAIPWATSVPRWLTGTVRQSTTIQGATDEGPLEVSLAHLWTGTDVANSTDVLVSQSTREAMAPRVESVAQTGSTSPGGTGVFAYDLVWDNVEIWWLPSGEATHQTLGHEWNKIRRPRVLGFFTTGLQHVETIGGEVQEDVTVTGFTGLWAVRRVILGDPSLDEGFNNIPEVGQEIDFMVVYAGPATENLPFHFGSDSIGGGGIYFAGTMGDFLKRAYDGEFSPPDPLTFEAVPTGIRYDEDTLDALTDEVLVRVTEPADDLRDWLEKNVYAATGYAPTVDFDGRIAPRSELLPSDTSSLVQIDDDNAIPSPGWEHGDAIVNVLDYTYRRYGIATSALQDASDGATSRAAFNQLLRDIVLQAIGVNDGKAVPREPVDRVVVREIQNIWKESLPAGQSSIDVFGEQAVEVDSEAVGTIGTQGQVLPPQVGEYQRTVEDEPGYQYQLSRKDSLFHRYAHGPQMQTVEVFRNTAGLRALQAGDWVRFNISWAPNYHTGQRGLDHFAQIVAINDLDCATRRITVEITDPYEEALVGRSMTNTYDVEEALSVVMANRFDVEES